MLHFKIQSEKAFSVIEAVLSSAVFALIVTALVGAYLYGIEGTARSGDRSRAVFLADEAIEAVRSIRDGAWNEIQFAQSGVDDTSGQWELLGEGTVETIGDYTRTIEYNDVCRDGTDTIVPCPGSYTDLNTKEVVVTVEWESPPGFVREVNRSIFLTNWEAARWTQTDWSGGDGQSIWSDITRYSSDDGNIDVSTSGEVRLKGLGGGETGLQMEADTVTTDENWETVNFVNTYDSPVVVASYYEDNNSQPASVRIRDVTATSMDVRLQSPSGFDLSDDQITYLVVEEGSWELDGMLLEAHLHDTSTVGRKSGGWNCDNQSFDQSFSSDPVVFHQVMTNNDSDWISTYVQRIGSQSNPPNTSGVCIALNGAEVTSSHGAETIGWIAIERDQTGTVEAVPFETYRTSDSVQGHNNGCYDFNYLNSYGSTPLVLVFQEEMDGGDGSWAVVCDNNSSQVGMHAEEDIVGDNDRNHTTETMAFIAFETAFDYSESLTTTDFVDDDQADFDAGSYNQTQWDGGNQWVEISSGGSGDYTSSIKDAGTDISWNTLSWIPQRPVQKELPNNQGAESGYPEGNINMSGNVLLMHMNEGSGTIADFSGQSNDGSQSGGISYGENGVYNDAIGLDGNNDYISISDDSSLDITGDITIEAWVYPRDTSNYPDLITKGSYFESYSTWIQNNGRIVFSLNGSQLVTGGGDRVDNNEWNHLVFVRDGNFRYIYLNGQLATSGWYSSSIGTNNDPLYISTPSYPFDMRIDEVAIYNRAISSSEVEDRYIRGVLRLQFQVRSCDDGACSGETFIGPDGTGSTYYSELQNTSLTPPELSLSGVADNQYFQYNTFFERDDNSYSPELTEVTVSGSGGGGGGGSGSGYETAGYLVSSAYDMGSPSSVEIFRWVEDVSSCTGCDIQFQIRSAPDSGGSPGAWTNWYGATGSGTYFTNPAGSLVPIDLNEKTWVQYRVELSGDGTTTPVLQDMELLYK